MSGQDISAKQKYFELQNEYKEKKKKIEQDIINELLEEFQELDLFCEAIDSPHKISNERLSQVLDSTYSQFEVRML